MLLSGMCSMQSHHSDIKWLQLPLAFCCWTFMVVSHIWCCTSTSPQSITCIKSIVSTWGLANIFRLLTVSLSQLMLTLEKTKYLSVSQTYGLCSVAAIFYGTVTTPSTFALICRAEAGLITFGHKSFGEHSHNLCWTTMRGSCETKQTYEQAYDTVWHKAHLIFKQPECCLKDCITCAAVSLSV